MSNREKIGPRINADLWQRFREDVQARKGQTRGVLGDELENAIRQYLRDEDAPVERRIDARLSRMEDALGIATADGGTDTVDAAEHTHAPSRLDAAAEEKPAANAATEKKVRYLASCVRDEAGDPETGEFDEVPRDVLKRVVKEEYGFRKDTAKRYVEHLVDHFGLEPHPVADGVLCTEDRREEIADHQREQERQQADAELTDL